MSLLDTIRRANRPGPPEHSIALRVACVGAVMTGIAACRAEGELTWTVAGGAMGFVALGMYVSYRTREHPLPWIKPVLAAAAVVAFVWFFEQLTGQAIYDVNTVENPLAVLFVWVQVAHAFDVPARRDLAFSLAGSTSLMAVAAAQAIDLGFGLYVLVWIAFGLIGLVAMWGSASGGGRLRAQGVATMLVVVASLSVFVLAILPAPHVAGRIDYPAHGGGFNLPVPGGLTGDGGQASEPAKPGSPSGASRVGGFLGFANRLDTALRGSLGNEVVMRVRAQRPSYWIGETFDNWDGVAWKANRVQRALFSGSPFPVPSSDSLAGEPDLQTFYIAQASPNLVFHADTARQVWFPARDLIFSDDGTIVSPIGLGPGAIYTVQSFVQAPAPEQLRAADPSQGLSAAVRRGYLHLPHPYPEVQALAESITAGASSDYDKVQALITWISRHTRYSTDIPPLRAGQDTVDEFLFGNRTGFCEQISTSMAVMLRSIGIPAREAVGFVPGPYNPITDLYEIQAKDAHAWVQVWFPGYGWQSFDPTASVPLANPTPGVTLLHDVAHGLSRLPWVPLGAVLAFGATALGTRRWLRRRPRTWAEHMARSIERVGRAAGRRRLPNETLAEYATALDRIAGDKSATWRALADMVQASAYGGRHPTPETGQRALGSVRALHAGTRRRAQGRPRVGAPETGPRAPRAGVSEERNLVGAGGVRRAGERGLRRSSPASPGEIDSPSADGDDRSRGRR